MNCSNDNIHTASSVTQDKKILVWALGRGARSKSKLHSPTQADHNWKPIDVFSMRLERQMGERTVSVFVLVSNTNFCTLLTGTSLY